MFGLWRLVLAFEVVIFHLFLIPIIGPYAVISFFVLSGFLMTTIMQKTYGYTAKGVGAFTLNRALRLHPNLWFSCLVTVSAIVVFGQDVMEAFHRTMVLPDNGWDWFQNLSLLFVDSKPIEVVPRLSPPTWALTIELVFYALIALGLSRSRTTTWIWFALSIAYHTAAFAGDWGLRSVYGSILGGSLPFAIGALTYHYRGVLGKAFTGSRWPLPALILLRWTIMFALVVFTIQYGRDWWKVREFFNVVNALLSAGIVICLFNLKASPKWKALDTRLGDFSYPVYLLHWQAAAIASIAIFGRGVRGPNADSVMNFPIAMLVLFLLCCVSVFAIDPAITKLRDKVRARADSRGAEGIVKQASAP